MATDDGSEGSYLIEDGAIPDRSEPRLPKLPQAKRASFGGGGDLPPPLLGERGFRSAATADPEVHERPDADIPAGVTAERSPARVNGLLLPGPVGRVSTGRKIWFAVAFLAPIIIGALYLFLIAPDQYVTEFRFTVRVPVGQPGQLAQGGESTSAVFGGNPTPGTDLLDNFTIADYARSSQAARDLDAKVNLKQLYNKPSDPFARVGSHVTSEKLDRYWSSMVYSDYDVTTGLAIVRVKAYTAQDSYVIANALLQLSSDLVNQIGIQSQQDTVRYAQQQVQRATDQVVSLRRQLAVLSAKKGIDSPSIGVISAQAQISTGTRTTISQLQSEIQVLLQQLHNPNAPQIVMLRQELAANERSLSGAVDSANEGATNTYLDLNNQLQSALTGLSTAHASLANAQASFDAQRLYMTTYVKPGLPDSPTAPDRWMDLFLIVLAATMVWMIGLLVRNSIMEHGL